VKSAVLEDSSKLVPFLESDFFIRVVEDDGGLLRKDYLWTTVINGDFIFRYEKSNAVPIDYPKFISTEQRQASCSPPDHAERDLRPTVIDDSKFPHPMRYAPLSAVHLPNFKLRHYGKCDGSGMVDGGISRSDKITAHAGWTAHF